MKIRQKAFFGVLIVLSLIAFVSISGYFGMQTVFNSYNAVTQESMPEMILLGQISTLTERMQSEALSFVLLEGELDEEAESEFKELEAAKKELEIAVKELEFQEQKTSPNHIHELVDSFLIATFNLANAKREEKSIDEILVYKELLEEQEDIIQIALAERMELEKAEIQTHSQSAIEVKKKTQIIMVAVTILALSVIAIFNYFITVTVLIPVNKLIEKVKVLSAGDFNSKIYLKSKDEIGVLATEFNLMVDEIKSRGKKLNELVETLYILNQSLRHDILNDLIVVKGEIDIFSSKQGKNLPDKLLKVIKKVTDKSISYIDKMKDIEAAISNEESFFPIDLKKLIDDVQEKYPNLEITVEGNATVLADQALTTVMNNLIANVWLHSGVKKMKININEIGERVKITVSDFGKGNAAEIKKKLYIKKHSRSKKHPGLGLFIVRKTIERYGGTVSVHQNKPQGIITTIWLFTGENKIG